MEKLKGAIAVFVGASSFGLLSTFVKKAYAQDYTLGQVTGVQAIFGMLILWMVYGFIQLFSPKVNQAYVKKTNKWKIVISGISTGLVSIVYYKCVQVVPASLAIVLLMQYIWIGTLIEFIFFKNKPSNRQLTGIAIVLVGTLLATGLIEQGIDTLNWTGILYGLLAATAYAVFLIVNGRVGNDYPPIQKSALMVTGSCIMICCLFPPTFLVTGALGDSIWHFGFILSFFGTVIPPLLFAYGIPKIGYSLSGILSSAELPVAVCMSYFILKEAVTPIQWLGVILILATVIWLNAKTKESTL
ncbi:EamA family transporter [Sphingobacterium faecium]|uniref:EamA family transporter n=1 Tax=Sphingobacterium faecium TaxID=34087 RepID=UPI00246949C3|nr:DMT family transporter [Sphingobacterium faecium]MDH5827799.1 DMT family transporter [Sphingobacterium faecium]